MGDYLLPLTDYMVHVWSPDWANPDGMLPGWENPLGTFGELNPTITCKDGTYHRVPDDKLAEHRDNVCLSK